MSKTKLSKSRVVLGLQCSKALYLSIHKPELAEDVSESQQLMFDQGHSVGLLAQTRFPGGVAIDAPPTDSQAALKKTADAIASGTLTLYEATFCHDDVLVKVDVLNRESPRHAWEIVEVKSSTQVKDVHLSDVAVQVWVCRGAGLKVKTASVMTINNQCVLPDLSDLFTLTDVTQEIDDHLSDLPKAIAGFKKMLATTAQPNIDIGPHCDDPYDCNFKPHCWSAKKIPTISVFDVPRLATNKKWDFYGKGKVQLASLDVSAFNQTQVRMIECTVNGKRFMDSAGIAAALKDWKFPLAFLDFETVGYAIPRYPNQRPYQQIPFQFSCHVRATKKSTLEHHEFLNESDADPREAISKALLDSVPKSGSVVAYNMGFESGVLKSLAEMFPKYRARLLEIDERLVDPLPIIRSHVYDPEFRGSFSIKAVAPALLGKSASYDGMAVGDGGDAQVAYLSMTDPKTEPAERARLRQALLEYCRKDTLGMVDLVDWLFQSSTS
ncbi:MAG: DUF2779 domain-containing protein [Bacteriovoracia bacterium]